MDQVTATQPHAGVGDCRQKILSGGEAAVLCMLDECKIASGALIPCHSVPTPMPSCLEGQYRCAQSLFYGAGQPSLKIPCLA